jgi:glycogen synthase
MKLLIFAHYFTPSIGGVETSVLLLARGLATLHPAISVTVVTQTPAGSFVDGSLPFRVVRHPTFFNLFRLIRGSDVVHVAGPSILPMAISRFLRKPTVVEHHGYQAICLNGLLLHMPERSLCPGYFQKKSIGRA